MMECPWVALRDVVKLFGVTYETAKNRIYAENFPVPVRREGKLLVVDKAVLERYFEERRADDLARFSLLSDSTKR
jgi:predicted site-specific integrase-resolvase